MMAAHHGAFRDASRDHYARRHVLNRVMTTALILCAVLALAPLFAVSGFVLQLAALPLQIFTNIVNPIDTAHDYPFAFAGVTLLFLLVVALNLGARVIAARRAPAGGVSRS